MTQSDTKGIVRVYDEYDEYDDVFVGLRFPKFQESCFLIVHIVQLGQILTKK
jgi:hypothetical protein